MYLRTRRDRLALTQRDLERKSGVAQNTISQLEHKANARPSLATVKALRALAVDPLKLQFGPDPRHGRKPLDARRRVPMDERVRASA